MREDLEGCVPGRCDNEFLTGQIQTHPASAALVRVLRVCVGHLSAAAPYGKLCIRRGASAFVCLHLVGWEKRQRLGESYRGTLQGLERMLIKASYSTASSFLTVPAAGSTTLCFLTTSSPFSLSALLYFCLPPSLSLSLSLSLCVSFPSLCLTRFPPALYSTCHLEAQTADVLTLNWQWCDACLSIYYFSKLEM